MSNVAYNITQIHVIFNHPRVKRRDKIDEEEKHTNT
jgi:hypothetical protein